MRALRQRQISVAEAHRPAFGMENDGTIKPPSRLVACPSTAARAGTTAAQVERH